MKSVSLESAMNLRSPLPSELEDLSRSLVDSAIKVHQTLGPGLLESVYETCLCIELDKRGIAYESQAPIALVYEGVRIDAGLRLDLLVEKSIILELKAVDKLLPIHQSQLLTYLKLADLRLGLLLNFNVEVFKQGIKRIIR
jgi:GxxExxY protein